MKHLNITYHICRPGETADGSIQLPMAPEVAASVLSGNICESLEVLLDKLAEIQGFDRADVEYAFGVEEIG